MTCKDCIHEKVCDALIKSGCPYLDEEVPADAFCMEFRNTADVVPKSEVENLKVLLEMTEKAHEGLRELYRIDTDALVEARIKTETEVAREIFEEIERTFTVKYSMCTNPVLVLDSLSFAELKKKYVEGVKNAEKNTDL